MNAARPAGRKRPGGGGPKRSGPKPKASKRARAKPKGPKPAGAKPQEPGAAFSIALSLFGLPMALAGLLFPLPAGLAAVLTAALALIAARGRKWPFRLALAVLLLGAGGLVGGLAIGLAVTAPA